MEVLEAPAVPTDAPEIPHTPAPRIVETNGATRIMPASEALDIAPGTLLSYQKQALTLLDEMRERVLSGEVIGVAMACVTADEGDTCISTAWSGGFMGFGLHGCAAVSMLYHRFNRDFYDGST